MERLKFDKEYQTGFYREYVHLRDKGIKYTYVKSVDNVTIWKYEKTVELFEALAEFYRERLKGD